VGRCQGLGGLRRALQAGAEREGGEAGAGWAAL
jgi:hypothetical protein